MPNSPLTSSPATPRWLRALLDNGLVLLAIAAMVPLGRLVDNPEIVDPYRANVIMRIGIAITLAVSLQLINGISGQFSLGHAGFMAVGAYLGGYATLTFTALTNADGDTTYFQRPFGALGFFLCLLVCALLAAGALFGLFALIRSSRKIHSSLPGIMLLAVAAWFIVDVKKAFELEHVPVALIWSKSIGWLGELFTWLLGVSERLSPKLDAFLPAASLPPLSFAMSLLGGGLFAGLVGFIVGLPTLRLRGDYLAIATLGFAAIIGVVIFNTQALGGATGLAVPPYLVLNDDDVPIRFISPWVFGVAVLTTAVVWRLARSPKGRAIIAVREDEIAAAATGIDVTHHKVLAFVIGAFFAGVAGSLFSHSYGFITTGSFDLVKSIELVIIVTIGGLGSISGAIIAAIVLTWLPEFLRDPASWIALAARPFGIASAGDLHLSPWLLHKLELVGEYRLVIYALLLILVMIARAKSGGSWWRRRTPARSTMPPTPPPTAPMTGATPAIT